MKLVLVSALLSLSQGFTPSRPLSARIAPKSTSTWTSSSRTVRQQPRLFDKTEELLIDSSPAEFSSENVIETSSPSPPLNEEQQQEPFPDVGKELFLDNMQENVELVNTEFTEFAYPDQPSSVPPSTTSATTISLEPLEVEKSLEIVKDEDVVASVSAILAASEEAVVAAEATLPPDLADKLEFKDATDETDDSDSSSAATNNNIAVIMSTPVEAPSREILPASSVVGEPKIADSITAPSVKKILKFAVPAIGVWLCGPLLSLIDTSSVGLLSGTSQQAALNPAVAVTDYAALLIAFLYTATTNLIAAARETDRDVVGKPRTAKTFIGAMQLSTFVGAGLGAVLFVFARTLLRAIIGNDGISPEVFAAAMRYVRIRALGMPAAAVIGSAQAACLGMQDIRSPLYVLGVAAAVNFMGDMLFVGASHPLIGGAAGAAWATVFSQYVAVGMFIHWLCNKARPRKSIEEEPPAVDLSKAILELTGKPKSAGRKRRKRFRDSLRAFRSPKPDSSTSNTGETVIRGGGRLSSKLPKAPVTQDAPDNGDEENFSVRGFLQNRFRARDLIKIPDKHTIKEVAEYVVPVTTTQVGRVSGYVAMSHVVSSSLGTISMAAQQVIVSLFYCLCPIADSLSLTAQSFLPAISEKSASKEKSRALKQTGTNFAKAGAIFGAVMVSAVSCIPLLSRFFTTDLYVSSLVNMVAPLLIGIFSVHGVVCALEGVLLGQKDLSFLGRMYAAYFAIVPYFMLRVKRAALSGSQRVNLTSVWKVFLGYQLVRLGIWTGRVALLQRRSNREAEAVGEQP